MLESRHSTKRLSITMPIPLWLVLFIIAGLLLFFFKISGDRLSHCEEPPKSFYVRLFLFIAFLFFAVAGIAAFAKWINSPP